MTLSDEQRNRAIREHRMKIRTGQIDIGPMPKHDQPIVDRRDMRDPEAMGREFCILRERFPEKTACEIFDLHEKIFMRADNYPPNHSMANITVLDYQDELHRRAAEGDRFAISLLQGNPIGEDHEID